MSKKQELWLAFAGDELTCTVVVGNRTNAGSSVDLILTGTITPARGYIYDLIMDVVKHAEYNSVNLDVRNLIFFSGHTVNDCAIEHLLKLVCYFSGNGKRIHLLLENGCVKDVLNQGLAGKMFAAVTLADARSPAQRMSLW